jgi:phage terminase large subunit GpA-like protein
MHPAITPIYRKTLNVTKAPPTISISQWADYYRFLSSESSAEAGKWYTDRAPYQRGVMNAILDKEVETIVVMFAAQTGKTEMLNNAVGYFIHQDPAPMLIVHPTLQMGEAYSKDRLYPMLRDTPKLAALVNTDKKRDGENTILHKKFPGGHITIAGANSPASLASRPIRVVLLDEVDRYPISAGTEGDPVNLARKRTTTFWNRKIILTSTPTIKKASRIETAYQESDQRKYYVPCPHCETMQILKWERMKWEEDKPETAVYVCEYGCIISDVEKFGMIRRGEWRATAPFYGTAGFHLNELYSPWVSFAEMAQHFLEAKKMPETLKTFINTALAETWDNDYAGEGIDEHWLMSRVEPYKDAPDGVLLITCGVDIQDDRIEGEVVGWGKNEESWSLEYFTIYGNPTLPDVWLSLDDKLQSRYPLAIGGALPIACTCIDSGGHYTEAVYQYCQRKKISGQRIYAVKGVSQNGKPIVSNPSRSNRYSIPLFPIGTDTAKEVIYSRFTITEQGAGYCHFPDHYEEEYFKQITAERYSKRFIKGRTVQQWIKTRSRNEALDCRVYALAALKILKPNWPHIAARIKSMAEKTQHATSEKNALPSPIPDKPKPTRRPRSTRNNGWVNRWR